MTDASPILDRRSRVRDALLTPIAEASLPEVRVLFWVLSFAFLFTAAIAMYAYSRVSVREMAVQLDTARSELGREQVRHDRLVLERTMLREPNRLGGAAAALGLVAPSHMISVAAAR